MHRFHATYNAAMPLTEHQRKHLRRLGHPLHPVVLIGQRGLTDGVAAEMRGALSAHELVKVRARAGSREERDAVLAELARRTESELVFRIGNVGLFYKRNKDLQKILLPDS
jgi:RNA-binding protein